MAGAALESLDCPEKGGSQSGFSLIFFMTPCLCLPGPPRGTSHPRGDVGVSPHPPACEGWPDAQLSLRLTEAFCTFSPPRQPLGCIRDLSMLESRELSGQSCHGQSCIHRPNQSQSTLFAVEIN